MPRTSCQRARTWSLARKNGRSRTPRTSSPAGGSSSGWWSAPRSVRTTWCWRSARLGSSRSARAAAARVIAVEKDAALAGRLARRFADDPTVRIVAADFLDVPLPRPPFTVFASLPFNATSEIVGRLLAAACLAGGDAPGGAAGGGRTVRRAGRASRWSPCC